ncbi:hypothetical protein B0T18DRAFT_409406 [Schizothecium vesticola]|uniref:Uncharacterized protein n=1 Tax=Schizothecium vesticola TaxID=314040 RepID=A0AA40F3Q3_9PEZI|nr:hypothetical protein B0T18DRAFT_409406 [Schizothecium vesticola]
MVDEPILEGILLVNPLAGLFEERLFFSLDTRLVVDRVGQEQGFFAVFFGVSPKFVVEVVDRHHTGSLNDGAGVMRDVVQLVPGRGKDPFGHVAGAWWPGRPMSAPERLGTVEGPGCKWVCEPTRYDDNSGASLSPRIWRYLGVG